MANNRMFLCYRPTGRKILLGKELGVEWYKAPTQEKMEKFFNDCYKDSLSEGTPTGEFCLLMEVVLELEKPGCATDKFQYIDFKSDFVELL